MLTSLTMMLFAVTCSAQQVSIVEQLSDGSYILKIDGAEFRAFGAAKMKELEGRKADLAACQRDGALAEGQIAVLTDEKQKLVEKVSLTERQRDDFKNQLQDTRVFVAQQKQLLDQEAQLRKDSQQFVPHGNGSGLGARLLSFFDKPAVQAGFKIGIPLLQTGKQFLSQCPR